MEILLKMYFKKNIQNLDIQRHISDIYFLKNACLR